MAIAMRFPTLKGRRLTSALLFAGAALVAGAVIGACTSDEEDQQAQAQDQQQQQMVQQQEQPQAAQPQQQQQQQQQDQPAQVTGEARENTVQLVKDRGTLLCGVKQTQPLFGFREPDGSVVGFDVDFCKAIAAAMEVDLELIDASDASTRFELLANGNIDVLIRTTTITASRDRELAVDFAQTTFYTGQGFAVHAGSGIGSTADMGGATICVQSGTTTEQNLADHFTDLGLSYTPLGGSDQETQDAFLAGRCDVWTADQSNLASRIGVLDNASDFVILGELISKEPLAPGVRDYDSEWKDVVNWVVHGLIAAAEMGITQANVAAMASNPPNTAIARLLGVSFEGGEVSTLGFDSVGAQFIQRAIAEVGNYGEIYANNVGDAVPRACSLNALASEDKSNCPVGTGGILYALPYR